MKYGKIRIEDGYLIFTKRMMINSLPCKDILWAYLRRKSADESEGRRLVANYLVIFTRRKKRYQFDMSEREVQECIQILKVLNPDMAVGFPNGGRIALQSLPNTRDLGAVMASDGRHILPQKLLRSGDLYHMSQSDQEVLTEQYHVKTVIDFRTDAERAEKPDTVLEGVRYIHIPIFEEEALGITRERGLGNMLFQLKEDAGKYMERQYVNLVSDPFCLKQYARFLDVLLRQEAGAVLYHCTAGKDRVGVGTAILLYILGVPRKTIREDFLRTNEYLEEEVRHIVRFLETKMDVDEGMILKLNTFFSVESSYMDTLFMTIEKNYGNFQHFLKKALYLTPKAIEELQNKYLI